MKESQTQALFALKKSSDSVTLKQILSKYSHINLGCRYLALGILKYKLASPNLSNSLVKFNDYNHKCAASNKQTTIVNFLICFHLKKFIAFFLLSTKNCTSLFNLISLLIYICEDPWPFLFAMNVQINLKKQSHLSTFDIFLVPIFL